MIPINGVVLWFDVDGELVCTACAKNFARCVEVPPLPALADGSDPFHETLTMGGDIFWVGDKEQGQGT